MLSLGPVATWDPQRLATPQDIAFAGRTFIRTLTAHPAGPDAAARREVVGDLATDAGTHDKTLKVWSFTLRDGVTWQDGTPVTCADVKEASTPRQAVRHRGPELPPGLPRHPAQGRRDLDLTGPWQGAGQASYDKAVSCKGSTMTFRLSTPMVDFNQVVALPVFAPVKKANDRGAKDPYAVFSNGPYQLKGAWDPSAGGTFVRNPKLGQGQTRSGRRSPDVDRVHRGHRVADRRAAGHQRRRRPPPSGHARLGPAGHAAARPVRRALAVRSVNPPAQFVDYLAPNVGSGVMRNAEVRQALALATNREGYVTALGGRARPTRRPPCSARPPGHPRSTRSAPVRRGTPAKARSALQASGLTLPVKITVAYRSNPTADKAMAALVDGWEDGRLRRAAPADPEDYFADRSPPGPAQIDVFWANWAPAWPSASTVIPPLFDSCINISAGGTGRDFGAFADKGVDKEITRISHDRRPRGAGRTRGPTSTPRLAKKGAYIALAQRTGAVHRRTEVSGLSANSRWVGSSS